MHLQPSIDFIDFMLCLEFHSSELSWEASASAAAAGLLGRLPGSKSANPPPVSSRPNRSRPNSLFRVQSLYLAARQNSQPSTIRCSPRESRSTGTCQAQSSS